MIPARLPDDPEIDQLRAQLAAQRQRKSGALVKHKRTTLQAVENGLRPTVFMDPTRLKDSLELEDEPEEALDADEEQAEDPDDVE